MPGCLCLPLDITVACLKGTERAGPLPGCQICGERVICVAGMCPREIGPSQVVSESGASVLPLPGSPQTTCPCVFFHGFVDGSRDAWGDMVGSLVQGSLASATLRPGGPSETWDGT